MSSSHPDQIGGYSEIHSCKCICLCPRETLFFNVFENCEKCFSVFAKCPEITLKRFQNFEFL